jgi:hypothetical protein
VLLRANASVGAYASHNAIIALRQEEKINPDIQHMPAPQS